MKFSTFQIIIGAQEPTANDLQMIKSKGQAFYEFGEDLYEFTIEFNKSLGLLWMYIQYDNKEIYNEEVVNETNRRKEKNPRSRTQVELKKQLFAAYSLRHHICYITNIKKRKMLSSYLTNVLQIEVLIKNIYTSIEEFESHTRYIKEAKFTHYNNLFSQETGMFAAIQNIYGLGSPRRLQLSVEYNNTPVKELITALRKLNEKNRRGEAQDIVIIGVDDDGMEQSFDLSTVINNLVIEVKKHDNGRYDNEEVMRRFCERLLNVQEA